MRNDKFVSECAEEMIHNGTSRTRQNGNLIYENGVLFSHGKHYPLLFKVDKYLFVNIAGYSSSTAKHINYAAREADFRIVLNSAIPFETTKVSIFDNLMREADDLTRDFKKLSPRAWRQRENIGLRINQVNITIKAIA